MTDAMHKEVAVIGAGITGAFTAFLLARAGYPVVLLDGESTPYRGSSCNPGGINPLHGPGLPHPMAGFYLSAHRLHADVCDELVSLSGMDYGFRIIDRLFLAFSPAEQQELLEMSERYNALEGFGAQWFTADRLQALDRRISRRALGGLFTHGNITVDSELYCAALIAAAAKSGCRYVRGNALDLVAENGRVSHVVTAEEKIACSAAVIATGYCADTLCSRLGFPLPVKPLKGELLVVRLPGEPLGFDVTWGLAGLYQYRDDLFWLGGTRDEPGSHPETTEEGKQAMIAGLESMLPNQGEIEIVAHAAGYRPQSADALPVAGFLPGYENVLVGTGGGSKGILLSAGIASALRDMMVSGNRAAIPYLSPERFDFNG
jgi:glycine oxidase